MNQLLKSISRRWNGICTYISTCTCTCTVLYLYLYTCTAMHCTVLFFTVQYGTVVFCTVLYCTVLYCIGAMLYYIIYATVLLYCNCTALLLQRAGMIVLRCYDTIKQCWCSDLLYHPIQFLLMCMCRPCTVLC